MPGTVVVVKGVVLMDFPSCEEGDPTFSLQFGEVPTDREVRDGVRRQLGLVWAHVNEIRFRVGEGEQRTIAPN